MFSWCMIKNKACLVCFHGVNIKGCLVCFFSLYLHLFIVIAHSFCIGDLFIDCINNLHMYRTLYQAGMFKTALKKGFMLHARSRE